MDNSLNIAINWLNEGRNIAIATVIETWGSAPRQVGSQMVVDGNGNMAGSVSSGCVEAEVIHEAVDTIRSGRAKSLSFGVADKDAFSVGIACGGEIRIIVQQVGKNKDIDINDLENLVKFKMSRNSLVTTTSLNDFKLNIIEYRNNKKIADMVKRDCSAVVGDNFVHVRNPDMHLVIVGAVHIAQYLESLANLNGFFTTVIDPRSGFVTSARFPNSKLYDGYPSDYFEVNKVDKRTAVAVLSHNTKIDDQALACSLKSDVFYIGVLGSRKSQSERLERLKNSGFSEKELARIHGPIGLDIGATSPPEIATSVIAQIVKVLRYGYEEKIS